MSLPHYLLHAETDRSGHGAPNWKFTLQSAAGGNQLTATDTESDTRRSRLELLAVVRGLEALDRPARVTLVTRSGYVTRGIRRQLNHWREYNWQWERFGTMTPILDADLWKRIDRALDYHVVECRTLKSDEAHADSATCNHGGWSFAATLGRLRRGVLTPISAIWRPTFTRAA